MAQFWQIWSHWVQQNNVYAIRVCRVRKIVSVSRQPLTLSLTVSLSLSLSLNVSLCEKNANSFWQDLQLFLSKLCAWNRRAVVDHFQTIFERLKDDQN